MTLRTLASLQAMALSVEYESSQYRKLNDSDKNKNLS